MVVSSRGLVCIASLALNVLRIDAGKSDSLIQEIVKSNIKTKANDCLIQDLQPYMKKAGCSAAPYTKAGISIAKHEDRCISYPDKKTSLICWHGEWKLDTSLRSNGGTAITHRRVKRWGWRWLKRIIKVVVVVVVCAVLVCDRGEKNEKIVYQHLPDITCPDVGGPFTAAEGEDTVVVTWDEPTVSDRDGDSPTYKQTAGLSSGSAFPDGLATIRYVATDNTGLTNFCDFSFNVKVLTCKSLDYIPNGRVVCDDGLIYGATCTYKCNPGYHTIDTTTRTCGADEQFDGSPPVCEKKECPQQIAPSNGEIICSDGMLFDSICFVKCNTAKFYRPEVTGAAARCKENGEWSVTLPQCIDFKEPDITCPQSKVLYADKLTNSTVVTWIAPTVTDNSGEIIVPQQTTNFVSGSRLNMGEYTIEYKATDGTGNAAICSFGVTVELLTCEPPGQQLYDHNLRYNCTHGHIYGSTCTISCAHNYEIQGNHSVTCESIQSPYSTHTEWSLSQSSDEPYCTFDLCSDLEPPKYGALACGTINSNQYCVMSCNANHGFPRGTDPYRMFVCDDQGVWNPSVVPDCTEEQRTPARGEIVFEIDFYNGNCSDLSVQESIEQQFIDFINSEIEKGNFIGADKNNYTIDKVKSSCDSNGRRRKRSLSGMQNMSVLAIHELSKRSHIPLHEMNSLYIQQLKKIVKRSQNTYHKMTKRSTYGDVHILDVAMSFIWNNDSSSLETQLVDNDNIVYSVWNTLETACDSGKLNFTGSAYTPDFKHPAYPGALCGPGETTFTTTTIAYCQGCALGSKYSSSTDDCVQCPLGTYQNQSHQQDCLQCPDGMSTGHIGAKDEVECLEICKPGTFSINGLEPCSLCKHGTYNPNNQSTSCNPCDSTKTTTKDGATSADVCLGFEILFDSLNEELSVYNTTNPVNNVTISMWLLIPGQNSTRPSLRISTSEIDELHISFESVSFGNMEGATLALSTDVSDGHWHHHAVTYNTVSKQFDFFFDGEFFSAIDCSTCVSTSYSGLDVTLDQVSEPSSGSTNDKSRLAGFQVVGKTLETTEIKQLATSCYSMTEDTLVDMGTLKNNDQVEITTSLLCDDDNACKTNPCGEHICEDKINGYKCFCLDGYTGVNCEIVPDYCESNDCQHGATCINNLRNYTCQCDGKFKGAFCEMEIVNGGWSTWERWGHCTDACGAATQTRYITCTQPLPDPDGKPCTGEDEQTQDCNLEACPECDKRQLDGYKVDLKCASVDGNGLNCNVSCPDGMMVLEDIPAGGYICNNVTAYQWNTTELPRCSIPRGVKEIAINASANMTSSVDCDDVIEYKAVVNSSTECHRCKKVVTISNCNNNRRRRRSITTDSVINLQFTIALNESDDFGLASYVKNKTVSPNLQEYIDSLTTLVVLASSLQNDTSPLTVTLNGVTYGVDQSTLNVTGTMQCDKGSYLVYGLCILCPVGTHWQVDYDCSPCTYGYYQNQEGQLECVPCPSGQTTEYIGSFNISRCIDSNETTVSTTPTTSQSTTTTSEPITTTTTTTTATTPLVTTTKPKTTEQATTTTAVLITTTTTTRTTTTAVPTTTTTTTIKTTALPTTPTTTQTTTLPASTTTTSRALPTKTTTTTILLTTTTTETTSLPTTTTKTTTSTTLPTTTTKKTTTPIVKTTKTRTTLIVTATTTATSLPAAATTAESTTTLSTTTAPTTIITEAATSRDQSTKTQTEASAGSDTKNSNSNEGSLKYILIGVITTASILAIIASAISIVKCILLPRRNADNRLDLRCEIAVQEFITPYKDADKPPAYTEHESKLPANTEIEYPPATTDLFASWQ